MGSDSDSDSSYSSSSDDSEERRRREKKERKRKREKKEKKERKRKEKKHKDKKHKDKDKKSDKKRHKREKEKDALKETLRATASGAYWGKYGIIKEGDMFEKQEEFLAWLAEHKGVQQEACGQREMKEHFSTFCEDYNTATLPSEKYYNLKAWYVKDQNRKAAEEQQAARSGEGGFERTNFDDESDRKADVQRERAKRAEATAKLMAQSMRDGEGLAQDMKEQQALQQQMRAAWQTGHVDKAREMATKLDPKYVSPEEMKKIFGGPAPLNSKKPGGMGSGH